jgi:plastocyanin
MSRKTIVCGVILFAMLVVCTKREGVSYFKVDEIKGDATIVRSGESKSVDPDMNLKAHDAIVIGDNSAITIGLLDGSSLYIGANTSINITGVRRENEKKTVCALTIDNGSMYALKDDNDSCSVEISTSAGFVTIASGDAEIAFVKDLSKLSVSVFSDSARVFTAGSSVTVPACTNQSFTSGKQDQLGPIAESQLIELKQWVPAVIVDAALKKSGCNASEPVVELLAPEWIKSPKELCASGALFTDTVKAVDPERGNIIYTLIKGPAGLTIGAQTGVIRYNPKAAGTFEISIEAIDPDSMKTALTYMLNVTEDLGVLLNVQKIISVNQIVSISASPVRSAKVRGAFKYRFDCDGDGIFETPSDKYGDLSRVSYQYSKEGNYKVRVDIKNSEGKTATAVKTVSVLSPPRAVLRIMPSFGKNGSDFLLDATGCSDNMGNSDSLVVRFDVDGDGRWDIPSETGFLREKKVAWSWQASGKYKVIVEAMNQYGLADTTRAEVIVSSGLSIDSLIAFDTVHVGDNVLFTCYASQSEFPVVKYEWSMDGDTVFELNTETNSIKYAFSKSGQYMVLCKVTDDKEQSSVNFRNITVINATAELSAGGTYNVRINESVALKGAAKDKDSRIVSYGWDLNGDGTVDSVSSTSSSLVYKFTKSGKKIVYFIVKTDDGAEWKDSAIVNVTNKKPIALAGDDIVSKNGKKVKLNGLGKDEDQNILKYEWDFDGNGTYEFSSETSGQTMHVFDTFAVAILKVTDSDGDADVDSVKIVICPDDMELNEKKKYCIDKYEYPNKKGKVPEVNVSFEDAQKLCGDQGKHLCTADEWLAGCKEGKGRYPYGRGYEKDRCNTMGNAYVKNKLAPSGEFSKCSGGLGTVDMSGNAAEWVDAGNPYVYGGSYQNGKDDTKCESKVQLQKGKKYFYVSFRCCK